MMNKKLKAFLVSAMLVTTSVLNAQTTFANTGIHYLDPPVMPEQPVMEDVIEELEWESIWEDTWENTWEDTWENTWEDEIVTYVTINRVHLRTGASTDFSSILIVPAGETVQVIEYDADDWSQVIYQGESGYIKSEFLASPPAGGQASQSSFSGVELASWSEVKNVFTIGVPAAVFDVYSGRTYYVKSFSNGMHADVEPVTAEDTAIMKETFNGVWSWDVRPVWVTINGRTFAGSINGMPHGGGTNNNNNMDGQVCIHFLNSTTHNNNSSYARLHQDVLKKAFEMA